MSLEKNQHSLWKRLLVAGTAAVTFVTGLPFLPSSAEAQQAPLSPTVSPILPGIKNSAGYTCLPRNTAVSEFNRFAIDAQVDADIRISPAAQQILMAASSKQSSICADKSLRRAGLSLGENMLSPGTLGSAEIEQRAARNTFLMAYELANFWLEEKGFGDQRLFQSQHDTQQYHMLREASTWALAANMLHDLKNYGREGAWAQAEASAYGDIFRAYDTALRENPGAEYTGIAHLRAVQEWFKKPKRQKQLFQDINWLLHGQEDAASRAAPLTSDILMGLGSRPEPGKPNFFSEVQNSVSIYPDRDPFLFYKPLGQGTSPSPRKPGN